MKNNTTLECTDYIPPKADITLMDCRNVLCQSGEVPDWDEGWKFDF